MGKTPAADVQIQELSLDSAISDIAYEPSTGQLIVAALTNNTTRIAVLNTNELTLGPTLLEGSGTAVIEPDGTGRIYVAFQGTQTVVLHDLRTGETSSPFSFGTGHQVLTMRVINAADRLISVSKHRENPGFIDTTLFRNGVPLTNWVLSTIVRAVAPGGGHVYSMFAARTKMRVDTNGLEVVTSFPMGPQGYNPDFLVDDNKLVVGTGHILSLDLEPLQTVPNAPRQSFDFNSVVFADPRTNILAFVWQRPFENSFVLYDERSGANVAELRIPMGGFAREIFPWGTNSYGLRWGDGEEGRLFIIDSQPAPRSDVSLTVESSPTAAANGTAISYKLIVRNQGPDPAESVLVHDAFTFGLAMSEAPATTGFVEFGANELFWTLRSLPAGREATLEIRGVATGPAFARNEAVLSVAGVDPNPANNRVTNTVPVAGEFAGSARTYLVPANSMISNPRSGELYLSIPSENGPFPFSVVRWKPELNSVEAIASYPTAPDRLALSENGEFLFVSLPVSGEIEQLDLITNSVPVRFLAGLNAPVGELRPLPGEPTSILAAAGGYHTSIGARVFDDGLARTNHGPAGSVVLLRNDRALQFHAESFLLSELFIDGSGITAKSFSNQVVRATVNLVGAGGRVFTENGWVIEPSTGAIVDTIPTGLNPLWAFDEDADEFYILSHDSVNWTMKRYQLSTLRKLADVAVPKPNAAPNTLVKWKSRGYAYKTASEIVLFSEPEARLADLALISTIVPSASGSASEPFTWVLTITNRGPNDAVNVELIAGASGATTPTWKPADASHERYPNPFARVYPLIKAGQSEKVELVIAPSTPGKGGAFQLSARIERFGEDTDYNNNLTFDLYSLPPALGVIRRYGITANDMAYNKPSDRLYLSVAASSSLLPSSIVSLDLNNFHLSHLFSLTNPPGVMASSDLADVGFAAVEGNLMAAQFEVEPRFFGPMFPIATQPIFEFLVQPGTASVLAVSHWRGITLFSNGVPREVTAVIGGIAFDSEKPDKLFHYFQGTVRRFHLGAEITEEASAQLPFSEQIPMIAANGRLFFPNGQIVDQTSLQSAGQLPDVPAGSRGALIATDRDANRLYLYQQFGNHDELRLFSTTNLSALGMISFSYTDLPVRLLAFDGRAALLAAGQLVLFDIPPTNKTDLAVSASAAPALDDVPVTLSISAWNNSPWPSGPASVEVLLPSSFALESVLGTNQFETEGQTIRFPVASFLNSETNIFRVSGRFTTPGAHVVTASNTSAAEEVGPLDNRFRLPVEVLAKPLVTAATASVLEGSTFRIQFTLSHRLPQIARPLFKMTITNGTTSVEEALNPTTNLTQTLFLNANTTNVFSTQFTARSDSISNGIRTLNILLSEPNGVELGLSNLTLRIVDDDAFPAVGNNPQGWNFIEPFTNRSSLIQLSLNRSGTNEARFDYHFRSKTALLGSDFLGEPGTIVIPAGQRIAQIPFTLLADSNIEESETFEVELSNPQNIYIMDPVVAININENPVAPAQIVRSFIREGRMAIQFRTIPNQRYRLLRAPELTSHERMPIGDTILDYGGSAELVDTDPTPHRQMFYRIEQKPL